MNKIRIRLSSITEGLRASLFFVPMMAVIGAIILGLLSLWIDSHLDTGTTTLPFGFSSTVDSARAVLSTIAGATISFAGIAFSVSLLIIQLASSQYSPRVVHTLFRDPFNKRVMALVVGTFTFCVIVLRSVRSAFDPGGDPIVPNLSVAIAVILGIATILAIVAFIDHSAHTMDVSEILQRVQTEAVEQIQREWTPMGESNNQSRDDNSVHAGNGAEAWEMTEPSTDVKFSRSGWLQLIDVDALLENLPANSLTHVTTFAGRYAVKDTPVCVISPPPEDLERIEREVRAAMAIGNTRTMQQDPSYGVRQLVDVTLKALSPSVNDPTTAQDAIFHCAAVLAEILSHVPPPRQHLGAGGRRLFLTQQPTHEELINLGFDEVRIAGADQPTVCVYLLEALELLCDVAREHPSVLTDSGAPDARIATLEAEARLVVQGCAATGVQPHDMELVRRAYEKRFGVSDPSMQSVTDPWTPGRL